MPGVQVTFHRLAAKEYLAARQRYGRHSQRLAQAFQDQVKAAVQKIADNPQGWPKYRAKYRWVRTLRFPYILFYRILDDTQVLIMAVAHGRRRPGYWQRRSQS